MTSLLKHEIADSQYVSKTASESFCLCYRNSCLALIDDVINLQNWLMLSVSVYSYVWCHPQLAFSQCWTFDSFFSMGCFLSQRFWVVSYNYYYYQSNLIWQKAVRIWWYVLCSKLLTAHCCHNQYIFCRPIWLQHVRPGLAGLWPRKAYETIQPANG